jgi:hypothetical protein
VLNEKKRDSVRAKGGSTMKEWVYKATESKIGYFDTLHLAVQKHFLCRSLVDSDGSQADRVREVAIGDIIHFYYKSKSKPASPYGSFTVVDGSEYETQFGERIEGTALFKVIETPENTDMIQRLMKEHDRDPARGYVRDAVHKCFLGWVIQRIDSAQRTPPDFEQDKLFPGAVINLWPYPDPELPRKRKSAAPR